MAFETVLGVRIDGSGARTGAREVNSSLDSMASRADRTQRQVRQATDRTSDSFRTLGRVVTGVAAVFAARQFAQGIDTLTQMNARLQLVTGSAGAAAAVQRQLFQAAQNTRNTFQATVDLYTRVARGTRELALSQRQLIGITTLVNQSFQISGATASEAASGVLQFGQALQSGVLQGDELRSIRENASRLFEAIIAGVQQVAPGLKVTAANFRDLASEGKITSDIIAAGLLTQVDKLNDEFSKIPRTIGGALTQLRNDLLRTVGVMDDAGKLTTEFTGTIDELREVIASPDFQTGAKVVAEGIGNIAAQAAVAIGEVAGFIGELDSVIKLLNDPAFAEYRKLRQSLISRDPRYGSLIPEDRPGERTVLTIPLVSQDNRPLPGRNNIPTSGLGGGGGIDLGGGTESSKAAQSFIDDLRFEAEQIGKTNREREIAIALRRAETTATTDLGKEVAGLVIAISQEEKAQEARKSAVERATAAAEADLRAREKASEQAQALIRQEQEVRQGLEEERKLAEARLRLAGEDERTREVQLRLIQEEAEARRRGLPLIGRMREEREKEIEAIVDASIAYEKQVEALEELKRRAESISRDVSDFIVDGFVTAANGGKAAFEDLFDAVAQSAKRFVARLAATLIEQQIILPITTQLIGAAPGLFGISSPGGVQSGGAGSIANQGQSILGQLFGGGQGFASAGPSVAPVTGGATASQLGVAAVPGGVSNAGVAAASPGLFSAAGASGVLGGATLGFGAGTFVNGIFGGNSQNGTIGAAGGAIGGAIAGAAIGSIIPGVGTVIGGLVGGLIGGGGGGFLGGLFGDSEAEKAKKQRRAQAQSIIDQLPKSIEDIRSTEGQGALAGDIARVQGQFNQVRTQLEELGASQEQLAELEQARIARIRYTIEQTFDALKDDIDSVLADPSDSSLSAFGKQLDSFAERFEELEREAAKRYGGLLPQVQAERRQAGEQAVANIGYDLQQQLLQLTDPFEFDRQRIGFESEQIEAQLQKAVELGRLDASRIEEELDLVKQLRDLRIDQLEAERRSVLGLSDLLTAQSLSNASSLTPGERVSAANDNFLQAIEAARSSNGNSTDISRVRDAFSTGLGIARDTFASSSGFADTEQAFRSAIIGLGRDLGDPSFLEGGQFGPGNLNGTQPVASAVISSGNATVGRLDQVIDRLERIERQLFLNSSSQAA